MSYAYSALKRNSRRPREVALKIFPWFPARPRSVGIPKQSAVTIGNQPQGDLVADKGRRRRAKDSSDKVVVEDMEIARKAASAPVPENREGTKDLA